MTADEMIKNFETEQDELSSKQAIQIFARLIELFGEMKKVQPYLKRLYIGMGTYTIDGDYICEYDDLKDESNTDKIVNDLGIDEKNNHWVVYQGIQQNSDISDHINDIINDNYRNVFGIQNHINEACIDFVKLCNYLQEVNMTTLFDGVNENGVIVSYGRGSCLDTYLDAVDSDSVELLSKHNLPIIFHNSDLNMYYKYTKID